MEVMPDPVVLMREDGRIAFANTLAAKLLGYAVGELVGLPLTTIVPERFRQRQSERSIAYFARPVVRSMGSSPNLTALCKNGCEIPVQMGLSPIETASGLLVAAMIRDISDRRQDDLKLSTALLEVERLRGRLEAETCDLRQEFDSVSGFGEFVGQSKVLKLLQEKIDHVAATDAAVLILGETGTGKELVSRAIHRHSDRKDHPLITVNCATLPASLMESELFGHEQGAFTGATQRKIGRFELANGGTIFLDEIGEMPVELQSKLLRVIQEGVFWRLGSEKTTSVNVRVVAATNRDLALAMRQEKFRPDLYYRLAVFPVEVPPLRERREDIPLLVWHFISQKQARMGKKIEQIPQATMDRLIAYQWPGNIRELENVLERAIILSPGSTLIVESLLDVIDRCASVAEPKSGSADDVLKKHIRSVLQECRWRIKGKGAAAERLGMNPSTLRYRMKKLGLDRK